MELKTTSLLIAVAFAGLSLTPCRAATILHSFTGGSDDGADSRGSLTLSGSKLYGMTAGGGGGADNGTIFSMDTDGSGYSLLHHFTYSDGRNPFGSLTLSGSTFYGMTTGGGSNGYGAIFSMNIDGSGFKLLRSFNQNGTDGWFPQGSLTLSGSKLYGMTTNGGSSNYGTIFSMNIDGSGFSYLHSFTPESGDGQWPQGSLTLVGSTLYGMTRYGGDNLNHRGTIFAINVDGSGYSLLRSFSDDTSDGSSPFGSLTLSGSKLHGMTASGGSSHFGTIFSMNIDGSGFSLLHSFTGVPGTEGDGGYPVGSLTLFGSTFYGMTQNGGSSTRGTIFSINTDGSGFRMLQSFAGGSSGGNNPLGDVTVSGDGSTLYGMTVYGGTADRGVVFSAPAPEPSTCVMLALGLPLLSGFHRRRRLT